MLTFEITNLFLRRKKRWLIVIGVLFALTFLLNQASEAPFEPLNMSDFLVQAFTQQFHTIVIIPMLFLLLLADLITADLDKYLVLVITRSTSRLAWLFSKIATLFIVAVLFTLLCGLVYFLVGLLLGMPLTSGWTSHSFFAPSISPTSVFLAIFTLYVATLFAFGLLTIILSMILRNALITWVVGAVCSVLSFVVWLKERSIGKWMLTAHMNSLNMIPNELIYATYSIRWALLYNFVLIVGMILVGIWQVRRMNLVKSS